MTNSLARRPELADKLKELSGRERHDANCTPALDAAEGSELRPNPSADLKSATRTTCYAPFSQLALPLFTSLSTEFCTRVVNQQLMLWG